MFVGEGPGRQEDEQGKPFVGQAGPKGTSMKQHLLSALALALATSGLAACTTIDAGPNVHVICTAESADEVALRLRVIPGVRQVMTARVGGPAHLIPNP